MVLSFVPRGTKLFVHVLIHLLLPASVKCDEQKPICFNCQKRNRECVYGIVESQTSQRAGTPNRNSEWTDSAVLPYRNYRAEPISGNVSPYSSHEPAEVAALQFFVSNVGKDLAGHFTDEVWCNVFPRIAQHEPVVWHATVAVSMLDTSLRLDKSSDGSSQSVSAALGHYGKAIQELNTRIAAVDGSSCRDVVLISCLLFAVFECLRNDLSQALKHISGGTKLLMEWTNDAESKDKEIVGMYVDRKALLPIYLALDSSAVQMAVVGFRDFTCLPAIISSISRSFSTVDEAHVALSSIFNRMGRWAHWTEPCTGVGKPPPASWVAEQQIILQENLDEWDVSFESLSESHRVQSAGLLLRVHRTVMQIFFDKCKSGQGEMEFDKSTAQFEKAVECAEMYLGQTTRTKQTYQHPTRPGRSFTTAMDIVLSLFTITAKCRDSKLRRRALKMLKTCNRKEGIWDSYRCALVAEKIVELEERGADPDGFIPESARVFEMDVHVDDEQHSSTIVHKRNVEDGSASGHVETHIDRFAIG